MMSLNKTFSSKTFIAVWNKAHMVWLCKLLIMVSHIWGNIDITYKDDMKMFRFIHRYWTDYKTVLVDTVWGCIRWPMCLALHHHYPDENQLELHHLATYREGPSPRFWKSTVKGELSWFLDLIWFDLIWFDLNMVFCSCYIALGSKYQLETRSIFNIFCFSKIRTQVKNYRIKIKK